MKKVFLFCAVLFALQLPMALMAQDNATVIFNAILNETFNITVTQGDVQTATFNTADDYNNGVTEAGGIVDGYSTITIEATSDWDLNIRADDFVETTTAEIIPINNLGVYCSDGTGNHTIGTEVLCAFVDPTTILGLSNADQLLMDLNPAGPGNAGTAADNEFILHWEMGTTQNASMNPLTMFEQMSNGDFGPGTYQTDVILTLNPK
jgi:hypothetical protein